MPEPSEPEGVSRRGLGQLAVSFALVLRERGLQVPISSVIAYRAALGEVAGFGPRSLYWVGRSIFVHRLEEIVPYNSAFEAIFGEGGAPMPERATDMLRRLARIDGPVDSAPLARNGPQRPAPSASSAERLATRDFATLSAAELADAHHLMSEIGKDVPFRITRRHLRAGSGRSTFDLRSTARRAVRLGGDLVTLERRRRRIRPRRLVAICDVSGSMDAYAREFIRFLHLCVVGRPAVEAFVLGTRLTRVTRHLEGHDADAALGRVSAAVHDWAGGTRLGPGIKTFNDRYGIRGMARGATVVICSDGIDRGDPELLARELARLGRVADRIIWVNPLKGTEGYEPTARAMAAALPHLDAFVSGNSVEALVAVAKGLAG